MSKQLYRGHTNVHCILHAYLHAQTHGLHSSHSHMHKELLWELMQIPNMLCRAADGVNAGVTRHVSHSIPPTETGDSPRGQRWATDGNPIPSRKSSAPASAASVIRSSCDTAVMCWGLFLRNGRVELDSSRIFLASVWTMNEREGRGSAEEVEVGSDTDLAKRPWTSLLQSKSFAHIMSVSSERNFDLT